LVYGWSVEAGQEREAATEGRVLDPWQQQAGYLAGLLDRIGNGL
jgi:hypothetical protein